MMKNKFPISILVVLVVLCVTFGLIRCAIVKENSNNNDEMKNSLALIKLGDPKQLDLGGIGISVENHSSGMNFYEREWQRGALGTVKFVQGTHAFHVDNVLSVVGSDDADVPEGIFEWNINFGVSPEQADTHEAALKKMTQFLADLKSNGWARYIDVDDPRLTGKQAWDYANANSSYSRDPDYIPTLEEWTGTAGNIPHWKFSADGAYLDVSVSENNMGGFVGKSTYLLTIKAMSEYDFYGVGFFSGDSGRIRNWKALLPAELEKYHADRIKTEAALKVKGYEIDTRYQDPRIKGIPDFSYSQP